jgi:hypothetical protein
MVISSGIFLENRLLSRRRLWSDESIPMLFGMLPVRRLSLTLKYVILARILIEDGMVPDSFMFSNSIEIILASEPLQVTPWKSHQNGWLKPLKKIDPSFSSAVPVANMFQTISCTNFRPLLGIVLQAVLPGESPTECFVLFYKWHVMF